MTTQNLELFVINKSGRFLIECDTILENLRRIAVDRFEGVCEASRHRSRCVLPGPLALEGTSGASRKERCAVMRDHNKAFCQLVAETFDCPGPVVEFGAYQVEGQEGFADLRSMFSNARFIGCDMRPGPGVDRVEDVSAMSFADASAGTIICLETFEHVFEVRRAFEEVYRVLKPGGLFILTSPFHFKIHGYPDDYWRMTPSCLRRMLGEYAVRVVGRQGPAKTPHTVMSLAIKTPAPVDAQERVNQLVNTYQSWLAEADAAVPAINRLKRQFSMLYRSKAERLLIRDDRKAEFLIDGFEETPMAAAG